MRSLALATAVALAAVVAVACGGGGSPTPASPTAIPTTGEATTLAPCSALEAFKTYRFTSHLKLESPQPSGESTPLPQPTATAEEGATATPARGHQFIGPFLWDYQVDADFVAPNRISAVITGGAFPLPIIVIGNEGWAQVDGRWLERPGEVIPYQARDVCQALFLELNLSAVQSQSETVNGTETLHYSLSGVAKGEALAKIIGPDSDPNYLIQKISVDVWLAEKGGWPARMEIRGSGFYADGRELRMELVIDIKDVNNKKIKVEPPT
ncbi:MAG: hypothetical protein Q8P22_12450 [Chloroflexota bacterium]|nr:hypothetical protein [Chloroflexota bacterium]